MKHATLVLTLLLLLTGCPPAETTPSPKANTTEVTGAALHDPSLATATAPETFKASFETSKGTVVIQVTRAWAPKGADRFYNLVKMGYFNDVRFFRVLKGFMAQFGINGDPNVNAKWKRAMIPDDSASQSNTYGMVTFATGGPNTRTTQLFINVANNTNLDSMGFTPFGKVIEGMKVVESLYGDYGEGAPKGPGPNQGRIQSEGNTYLNQSFPKLDYVKTATIVD